MTNRHPPVAISRRGLLKGGAALLAAPVVLAARATASMSRGKRSPRLDNGRVPATSAGPETLALSAKVLHGSIRDR